MVKEAGLLDAYNAIIVGCREKQFVVIDFEYLDDYDHYKGNFDIEKEYEHAETLLHSSSFRFCIVGKLFPYSK